VTALIVRGDIVVKGSLYAAQQKIHPQSVTGTFRRLKWALLWLCLGIFYLLPFARWDRGPNLPHQAVLIDFDHARFYFFPIELWAQELYYITGLMVLGCLALFLSNALIGRAWCGFVCPQTIWTDMFVWVERRIEGDRRERIKLDAAPWTGAKIAKRAAKHAIWLAMAASTGVAFVLYFGDAPTQIGRLATLHASYQPWLWIGVLTSTTYGFAGHMREQYCQYVCPWPRIQGALTDPDSLSVAYRIDRGEPKMSLKAAAKVREAGQPAGDCIDCNACVNVCPAGVDIRLGYQAGCIQCGLCIDACDATMRKVGRPTRLIGYDTDDNVRRRANGEASTVRLVRPRTLAYAAMIAVIGAVMLFALATRQSVALSVQHVRMPMYTMLKDGSLRNGYALRIANKGGEARRFSISVEGVNGATVTCDEAVAMDGDRPVVAVAPDSDQSFLVFITAPSGGAAAPSGPVAFRVVETVGGESSTASDHFFGP